MNFNRLHFAMWLFCEVIFFQNKLFAARHTIPDGDISAFIIAINTANENAEIDTILLASNGRYTFTTANHETTIHSNGNPVSQGGTALPAIQNPDWPQQETLDLVIEGNGATIIRNSETLFRFLYIHTTATVVIRNTRFENGRGKHRGGAIFSGWRTALTLENCTFTGNQTFDDQGSNDQGGGAIMISSESRLTIRNCIFKQNRTLGFPISLAGNGGGAVMCLLSNLWIENSKFLNNYSDNFAGALYVDGAKHNTGTVFVKNCEFIQNTASGAAGALLNYIYNQNNTTIDGCHFEQNNSGSGHGGAVYSGGMTIDHSGYSITPNSTRLLLRNSSFIANSSINRSGALFVNENHSIIQNCTFSQNNGGNFASAIFVGQNRLSCAFINLTIAQNGTNNSNLQAVYVASTNPNAPKVKVKNCIFSENNAGHLGWNSLGQIELQGVNLQYPDDEFGGNVLLQNPLLSAPAFNGGLTKTMALQEGSPAIDAGADCSETDQRGAPRIGNCDLGAFEFGSVARNLSPKTLNQTPIIYPNPCNGLVHVQIPENQEYQIKVVSSDGKVMHDTYIQKNTKYHLKLPFKGFFLIYILTNENQYISSILNL